MLTAARCSPARSSSMPTASRLRVPRLMRGGRLRKCWRARRDGSRCCWFCAIFLVAPFGLKTSAPDQPGTRDIIGLFPVVDQTPDRLVAGFNDKHLDFRL